MTRAANKVCLFLSYSSKDKVAVRRLNKDLKKAGFDTWFDEDKIGVGDRIPKKIQEGLDSSHFVCIWLTKESVMSGWVEKEWSPKIIEEIEYNKTVVLPLLAETCILPVFLRDKRFADFRDSYNHGLNDLVAAAKGSPASLKKKETSITTYVSNFLWELREEKIELPLQEPIPILSSLQKIPRSGKKIRLLTYEPRLTIRTVYDHIFSVAHSADCLLPVLDHGIRDSQRRDLALCIAYHELNEIVLGDIPSYTKLNSHSRQAARILAQPRLKDVPKRERERITHEFIALFLDSRERDLINTMLEIFSDETNPVFQLFYALDKLDPIIATWRYLHTYRGKLDRDAADFLQRMKNFFEYPDVPKIAAGYTRDTALTDLVSALRNEQLAADYYIDRDTIRALRPFGLDTDLALRIIEGVDLIKKK